MTVESLATQFTYAAFDRIRLEQLLKLQRKLKVARRANQTLAEENVELLARLSAAVPREVEEAAEVPVELIRAAGSKLKAIREETGL